MSIRTVDLVILFLYFACMAAFGVWFARRNRTTEAYFLGNRSFPGWAIGISMIGTSISSVTFLAYPGDAFKTAWLRMLPNFMLPVGVLVAAIVFLPFFRRSGMTSAFEYLEGRFGPGTRVYGAVAFLVGQVIRISLILYLVSLLVHEATGFPVWACILIGSFVVSFYTILGGIEAVIWTDVVQTIVLIVGGVLVLARITSLMPGGFSQIFTVAAEHGKFAFADLVDGRLEPAPWGLSLAHKTGSMMLLIGLTNWLAEYSSNQNVVQRYCASRSIREARKAMAVCALSSVPIWAFFMFIGTALFALYTVQPEAGPTAILAGAPGAKAEQILPYFVFNELWPGVAGLVIAAVLAAAMSSLDSSINAMSTVAVTDLYRRHLAPGRDDAHYLRVAKGVAAAAAVLMTLGALVLATFESKTLQDTAWKISAITAGGLLGLFLLGFLTTRGGGRPVGIAIACTVLFSAYRACEELGWMPAAMRLPVDAYYTGLLGHILLFTVALALASLFPQRPRDLTNLTVWTRDGTPPT